MESPPGKAHFVFPLIQAFNLIRYFGGQHSIYVSPKTLETYYTNAKPNWQIDPNGVSPNYKPYSERSKIKISNS